MKIYIKNMVCSRCKMVVRSELEKLGLTPIMVELGEVEVQQENIQNQMDVLQSNLQLIGFDIIDDKRSRTIEKIKSIIIDVVHNKNNELPVNLSEYIAQNLNQDYKVLSNLFSEVANITIEKYFIAQKIEKVKELLMYDELSLSEIAFKLNYSSVGYLSNQFKKVTGFSPSYFKHLKDNKRKHIDDL